MDDTVAARVANADIRSIAVDELHEHPKNPNRRKSITDIIESIRANGFFGTLVVQQSRMRVLAGNHSFRAAKACGLRSVPCAIVDCDDETALRILLVDNRLAEGGSRDDALLAELLQGIGGLEGTGYAPKDLDALLAELRSGGPLGDAVDPDELGKKAASKLGCKYHLGPHVLLVADSTSAEAWASLFADRVRPQAMWTDPPYGVSYKGKTKDALEIQNDAIPTADMELFLERVWSAYVEHAAPGACLYVADPAGPHGLPFANTLDRRGLFRQRLAWVKDRFVLGHSDYHYRHEDIFFGYTPGDGRRGRAGDGWFGDNAQDTVHEITRPCANKDHPTMKPVELIEKHLANSTAPGWVVVDPFGGSGSTLVACARLGRVCRTIEIDPLYADVIRRRWAAWARSAGVDPGPDAL